MNSIAHSDLVKREILHADKITVYGNRQADLINFSFHLVEGEVLGIVGLRDSGIQTLVDFLIGKQRLDSGDFHFDAQLIQSGLIKPSWRSSIYYIGNVPQIFPALTVAENLCVIRSGAKLRNYIHLDQINELVQEILDEYDLPISPLLRASQLTISQQHVLELVKAKMIGAKVVLFSNSLSEYTEIEFFHLQTIIRSMQDSGTSFIITESQFDRAFSIVDRLMLVRNGRNSGSFTKGDFDKNLMQQILMGKHLAGDAMKNNPAYTEITGSVPFLEIKNLTTGSSYLQDLDMNSHRGEITGVFAIDDSCVSELAEVLLGFVDFKSGAILINGTKIRPVRETGRLTNLMGYFGKQNLFKLIFEMMSVKDNLVLGTRGKFTAPFGLIKERVVMYAFKQIAARIGLNIQDAYATTKNINTDAQIRLLFEKSFIKGAAILIVENPFSGTDLISRRIIFDQIMEAKARNLAVLFISNNFSEIQALCDRTYILREGKIAGEMNHEEMSQINMSQIFRIYEM